MLLAPVFLVRHSGQRSMHRLTSFSATRPEASGPSASKRPRTNESTPPLASGSRERLPSEFYTDCDRLYLLTWHRNHRYSSPSNSICVCFKLVYLIIGTKACKSLLEEEEGRR